MAKQTEEPRTPAEPRPQILPDFTKMIPFCGRDYLRAEGTKDYPQKAAFALGYLALEGERGDISFIDPLCENGTTLMVAGASFSQPYVRLPANLYHLFGLDFDANVAAVADLNLDEIRRFRLENGHDFPNFHVASGNALTYQFPRVGDKSVAVFNFPTKGKFFDVEGRVARPDITSLLKNIFHNKIPKVVLSVDSKFSEEDLEVGPYNFERVLSDCGYDFYVGKRK